MDVKGSDLGFGLEKVPQGIVDLLILFALILLSILLFVPKTQSQNAIGVAVRDEHSTVPTNHRFALLLAPGRVLLSSVPRRTAPAHLDIAPPLHSISITPR